MKRYVRAVSITAMATDMKFAIKKLDSLASTLETHVLRLGIYDDSLDCKDHWIRELANFLSIANDIKVHTSSGKLDKKIYRSRFIGGLGDARSDASVNVRLFKIQNDKTHEYPNFDDSSKEVVDRVFKVSQTVCTFVNDIMCHKNDFTKNDIFYYLKNRLS